MKKALLGVFLFLITIQFYTAQELDTLAGPPSKKELLSQLDNLDIPQTRRMDNLRILGEYYMYEQADSAYYFFYSAMGLAKLGQDSLSLMKLYNRLALTDAYYEKDDRAIAFADSALTYGSVNNVNHAASIGYSYRIQALSHYFKEENDKALEKLLTANRFLLRGKDNDENKAYLAENYADLANIYLEIKNYETAINCISRSLELSRPVDAWQQLGEGYDFLASYHLDVKNFDQALNYLDSAKVAYEKIEHIDRVNLTEKVRGNVYVEQGKYDEAIAISKGLLDYDIEEGLSYVITDDYLFLTDAYTKKGDLTKAKMYLDLAQRASSESIDPIYTIGIRKQRAAIFKEEGELDLAINELHELLQYEMIDEYKESQKAIFEDLYKLYDLKNDQKNAFVFFKKHAAIKDSLQQILQTKRFNILQTEFKYNELVSKLETQETQLDLVKAQQNRTQLRNSFLVGIVILIALFSIILFLRQRKLNIARRIALESKQEVLKVKQEVLDNEVHFKNKQITDFAIHISKKNELLENIKGKLKRIKVINDTYKEMVNDVLHFINNDIEQNKEKIQLYQQVNETKDSFRAKLDRMYTNLSQKERKVATMLRLGQTSKQIALQLNISAASVDNYRYTLRKKMNVSKGESLKTFIQNI